MSAKASAFPDQPRPGERDANQLQDGKSPSCKAEDLPDGGGRDDDLVELSGRALEDVDMATCDRVEGPWAYRAAHG